MSVPFLVGGIKSKADYDRKVDDYKRLLRLRARLNTIGEKGSNLGDQIYKGEVIQPPMPFISEEEISADVNTQRGLAIDSVEDYMVSRGDAVNFVNKFLTNLISLQEFNSFFNEFSSGLSGNYTPFQMNVAWEKFKKQYYAGTSDIASLSDLQEEIDQLSLDILGAVEGDPVEFAKFQKVVQDASRRYDVNTLRKIKKQVDLMIARQEATAEVRRRKK